MNSSVEMMSALAELPKDAIKAVFGGLKSQMEDQLLRSADALKGLLDSEELTEQEKEVFVELETNLTVTVGSLGKVIDLIINKIDEEN